jgi:uncharacterized protein
MSSSASANEALFKAAETRRTIYTLTKKPLPVPISRIQEIVSHAIKHCPSPFNTQSTRAIIMIGDEHNHFWDTADTYLKNAMPEQVYQMLAPRVAGFRAGYGTVAWYEDQDAIEETCKANPAVKDIMPQWSEHSNGMHQFFGTLHPPHTSPHSIAQPCF